jgi:hypothetical protein
MPASASGTHGVYGRPELDVATARLVFTAATAAATFYIEANAVTEEDIDDDIDDLCHYGSLLIDDKSWRVTFSAGIGVHPAAGRLVRHVSASPVAPA